MKASANGNFLAESLRDGYFLDRKRTGKFLVSQEVKGSDPIRGLTPTITAGVCPMIFDPDDLRVGVRPRKGSDPLNDRRQRGLDVLRLAGPHQAGNLLPVFEKHQRRPE